MAQFQAMTMVNVRSGPGTNYEIWDTLKPGDLVDEVVLVNVSPDPLLKVLPAPYSADWCPISMDDGSTGWINRQYLKEVGVNAPQQTAPQQSEPPWITWMRSKLGINQTDNAAEIESWDQFTSLDKSLWHQIVAWCAITVCAAFALSNSGKAGDRDAWAADYLNWGQNVDDDPQKGDVVVFDWNRIGQTGHHATFFLEDIGGGYIKCIGGNQHHAITIANFPVAAVAGYRRAV